MDTNSTSGLIIRLAFGLGLMAAGIGYGMTYLQERALSTEQPAATQGPISPPGMLDRTLQTNNDNSPPVPSSEGDIMIPLIRKGRSMFVQAELNEFRDATLLVDTGATEVTLTPEVAFDLGLIDGDTPESLYMTANGEVSSYVTTVESLRLGETIQYDVPVSISKNQALAGLGDGLLGMSFFEHYIVHVDSAGNRLHLRPRNN